jgi:hypothetical protein
MNKKERRLALATALQSAAEDTVVVDSVEAAVADGKTKSMVAMLDKVRRLPGSCRLWLRAILEAVARAGGGQGRGHPGRSLPVPAGCISMGPAAAARPPTRREQAAREHAPTRAALASPPPRPGRWAPP